MILSATDLERIAAVVSRDACQIGMQLLPNFCAKQGGSVLRAEDHVNEDVRKRLRHELDCISPFQG